MSLTVELNVGMEFRFRMVGEDMGDDIRLAGGIKNDYMELEGLCGEV